VAPIHVATTFIRDPDGGYASGFAYGRPDNATVREAEGVIAMLEEAAAALLFGSGMAAATAVFGALDPGDHVSRRESCTGRCATGSERRRCGGA
jgi:cystathionine gamma-synthase